MESPGREWALFFLQTAIAFVPLFIVNLVFLSTTTIYDGGLQAIGFLISLFAGPVLTNLLCVVVGSPIRLWPTIRRWWRRHRWIAPAGAGAAAVLLVLAFLLSAPEVGYGELGDAHTLMVPNIPVYFVGWFLLSFSITHWWPPLSADAT